MCSSRGKSQRRIPSRSGEAVAAFRLEQPETTTFDSFAMVTAVDTSVLLDVLLDDVQHASASMAALHLAAAHGPLIISDVALAEVVPVLPPGEAERFLTDWNLRFTPATQPVATLAGEMFRSFLQRGGKRGRVVPDFLIAAHAQLLADRLLARDRGYYRDYFAQLTLLDPTKHAGS
jgi:predicted nucleic acid-binding protein